MARAAPAAAARRTPNVIIVYCDDLGYGDLSCYGAPLIRTPVVDRLAAGGMRFTTMYSASPLCTPSRAALLTGCYAPRVNLPYVLDPRDTNGLAPSEVTIAAYLREAGYATACVGKWHLGAPPRFRPGNHGFDRFYGLLGSNDWNPRPALYDGDRVVEDPADQPSLTRRYTEQAVSFVRDHADRPFFLYLAHTMPHAPLSVEPEFAGRSAGGDYGDAVEAVDHHLGVLLGELDRLGIRQDTMVIFTSDNGPWYVGGTGPFSGRKAETYEGGVRVPFVLSWPGTVPAGLTYAEPACMVDVLPTLAAITGARLRDDRVIDGTDLSAALLRGRPVDRGDIFFYSREDCNAVRRGRWKLHVGRFPGPFYTGRGFSATEELPQLFDLDRDPEEAYDLSARHPALVAALTARIREFDEELQADRSDRS
ncbi:arylsulfatase [Nonomuraea mesophila]|uniref:Arylsulfatase n=2 Tax=Nonomuraea mesophila TaxID=2530382 RepID=A0A4R5FEF6_9ACTN|nr:arylsulfatase [Nonomuraea mesophila]